MLQYYYLKTKLIKAISLLVVLFFILFGSRTASAPLLTASEQSDQRIRLWVYNLAELESDDREDIVILDSNGKYSYSCLMFQMGTWTAQGEKYNVTTTEENIMDCKLQKQLAFLMIKDNPNNWRHWYNTVTKLGLGLPPNI